MLVLFGWPVLSGVLQAFGYGSATGFTDAYWDRMAGDPVFWAAVRNTLLLIVVLIPVQFCLGIAMALLLRAKPRFSGVYFYLWAVPLAISDLAAGLVWLSVFTDRGYLNSLLEQLGIAGVDWLNYQSTTKMLMAVVIAELWRSTSLVLVIVVSGMQMTPRDYDEAAQVFGATFWQRLRHVTLPLLKPSLQVALILRTILAFQAFAVAQALTGRQFPLLIGETYWWYVQLNDPNVASAVAVVVLGVSMVTALVYLRLLRSPDAGAR
ncbi:MAG: ABC transporter permease subunit [Micromonosporaceae bacterium]|nr:ABC transporter permease subunit [Micromonosporaceae bacterium]